jgi:hypothetical protein
LCIHLVNRFIDARTLSLSDLEKVADLLDAKVVSGDLRFKCKRVTVWYGYAERVARMKGSGMRDPGLRFAPSGLRLLRPTRHMMDVVSWVGNPARKNAGC